MRSFAKAAALITALATVAAATAAPDLERRFAEPTQSARPRVWWHWIDGNVTREGITRDLEWMKRSGIAGFQMFDIGRDYPALVDQPATIFSPQWQALVRHAAAEADRLGLEMTMATSAGWSETGGPFVEPESAMKKLVWSETRIAGGQRYVGTLPPPPSSNGPYQDLSLKPPFQVKGEPRSTLSRPRETFYTDARVIACRVNIADAEPVAVSASAGTPELPLLRDGSYSKAVVLPVAEASGDNWLQVDFGAPVTIRSLRLGVLWQQGNGSAMPDGAVLASDDGQGFREVAPLPASASASGLPVYTLALPATTARYFRVSMRPTGAFTFPGLPLRKITEFRITEADFSTRARAHRGEVKAAFAVAPDYEVLATAEVDAAAAIGLADVIDVTDRMSRDGRFDWTPPAGDWRVLRFGQSLTGQINAPATQAGTGFEVDKYDAGEVRRYLDRYYGPILESLGELHGRRGLQALLADSYEAGQSNWTPALIDEFRARRGYDMTRYLPALAGYVVGDARTTDRFLWDFRRTLADLLAENHYKVIAEFAQAHGLGFYGEAMGVDLPATGDGLQAKRYADVPMAEFWQVPPDQPSGGNHIADVREAASAAHVYGQNIVATESFTSFPLPTTPAPYTSMPWLLKPLADRFMALGVNRFIIHAAVHQPLERPPGFTLSIFGQFFSRHETWGEMARGWTDYLARASELLQYGRYAADIAYFYGEGAAITVPAGGTTDPAIPAGYGFDFVCRDMLLNDFAVRNGRLTTQSGMAYRLLVLPASTTRMSLALAHRLRDFVAAGATLVGPRPRAAAGLGDRDEAVAAVVAELWGDLDGTTRTSRSFGKGRVYWGMPLDAVLKQERVAADVRFAGENNERIVATHRTADDAEIYFVANQAATPARVDASLAVSGREAELWHADDGRIEPASYRIDGDRTTVPLALAPYESVFVVLRKTARATQRVVPAVAPVALAIIDGSWDVEFAPQRGAPAQLRFDRLASWSENADAGVHYFSGVGSYRRVIDVAPDWLDGSHLWLDLGEVRELAQVWINGEDAGIAWKPPYRVEVSRWLKPGRNELRIDVANLWVNRIIGDRQPGADKAYSFSTYDLYAPGLVKLPYAADTPLLPSGLLGPVRILSESR